MILKLSNTKIQFFLLTFLLTLLYFNVFAQAEVKFDRIGVNNGLSDNNILSVIQDHNGFIWIGTHDGLNKYDGYDFTVFKNIRNDSTSLPDNIVRAICQSDINNNLWLGTNDGGLCCYNYNSEKFTSFKHNPDDTLNTIASNTITNIVKGDEGLLWLGFNTNKISCFNTITKKAKSYIIPRFDAENSEFGDLYLYYDSRGFLWICTKKGLYRFDSNNEKFTAYQHNEDDPGSLPTNLINAIYEDKDSYTFWIGTEEGLIEFSPDNNQYTLFQHDQNNPASISNNHVYTSIRDNFGHLWIGSRNGLNKFNDSTYQFTHYKNDPSNPGSLSSNNISKLYIDKGGVLWVGTFEKGINKTDTYLVNFKHYKYSSKRPEGLPNKTIRSIYQDKYGILWVGAVNGGLTKINLKNNTFENSHVNKHISFDQYEFGTVTSIYEDHKGNFWVGTWTNGIAKATFKGKGRNREIDKCKFYSHDSNNPYSLNNNSIQFIFEDSADRLWIGTADGLNMYDYNNDRFKLFSYNADNENSLSSFSIQDAIAQYNDSIFWLGTWNGLNKITLDADFDLKFDSAGPNLNPLAKFEHFYKNEDDFNSLSDNRVISVCLDNNKNLWVGTHGGGLNKMVFKNDSTIKYTNYRESSGFSNNVVYCIFNDNEDDIWCSTNNGITEVLTSGKMLLYNENDGLQGKEFFWGAGYKSPSGEMFFGGTNGFNSFFPSQIKANPYQPPVVFTNLSVLSESVKPDGKFIKDNISEAKEINLNWSDKVFTIEFSALHFYSPKSIRYQYKLNGFDNEWISTDYKKRAITYTNLNPGSYTFFVKATNSEGDWSKDVKSIVINIKPPFYKTLWFQISFAVLILCLIFAIILSRLRSFKRQKRILEIEVHKRTLEIEKQNKEIQAKSEEISTQLSIVENIKAFNETLIESTPIGQLVYTNEGECIMANEIAVKLIDAPNKEALLKQNFHEIDSWKVGNGYNNAILTLSSGKPSSSVEKFVTTFGKSLWMEYKFTRFVYNKSQHLLISFSDVTEEINQKEALRKSELYLTQAQTVAGVGSWHLDIPANELSWSDQTYKIFGVDKKTKPTLDLFFDIVHNDDKESVSSAWAEAMNGTPYNIEHRIIVNGKTRWVNEKASVVFDDKNNPLSGVGIAYDITERKETALKLTEAKKQYESLIEGLGEKFVAFRINQSGLIQYASKNFMDFVGVSSEEAIGQSIDELTKWTGNSLEVITQSITKYLNKEIEYDSLELSFTKQSDNTNHIIRVNSHSVVDDTNELIAIEGIAEDITEKKLADTLLTENKRRLELAMDVSKAGIFSHEFTKDKREVILSDLWFDILGYNRNDIPMGKELLTWLLDQIHDDDRPYFMSYVEKVKTGEKNNANVITRIKNKAQEWISVNLQIRVYERNDDGSIKSVIGVMLDVTEKLKAEKALKDSERMTRFIIESSPVGIVVYSKEGEAISANKRFTDITGFVKDDILTVDMWLSNAFPDKKKKRKMIKDWITFLRRDKAKTEFNPLEILITCKDGSVKNIDIELAKTENLYVVSFVDTTKKIQAFKEVERGRALLNESERLSKTGAWEYDINTGEHYWSEGLYELLEREEKYQTLIKGEFFPCYSDEARKIINLAINKCINSGETFDLTQEVSCKDNIKWIRSVGSASVINNKTVKITGSSMDITDIKKSEVMLKELNNTKDKFFSILAHDLRSPLASLKSISNILTSDIDMIPKDELSDIMIMLDDRLGNTLSMMDNLLVWANDEINKANRTATTFKISDVLNITTKVYEDIAKAKDITIIDTVDESFTIYGDKNQTEFILRNLINNAIKFTNPRGNINISAVILSDDMIDISVSDNGIGIPKEKINTLFKLNVDKSTTGTTGEKGTGLGLMLAYDFAKQNGGELSVESTPGKGTTFHLMLKSKK